jgi:ornithine carbamoyltransferase
MRIATTRGGDAVSVLTPEQQAQQAETLKRAIQVAAKKGAALTSDDLKSITPAPIMVTPDAVVPDADKERADDAVKESFFAQYKTPLIISGLLLGGIILNYLATKRKK